MPEIEDGDEVEVQGSAALPYKLKNTGGVYSCSCPAWRNQGAPIERRTCKHLRAYRGESAETERVGSAAPPPRAVRPKATSDAPEGAATSAPPLLLAHPWETHIDLAGWWMSEKLDGVRAYWNGEIFISRLGNEYRAPKWFTEALPSTPLDGELWCGRKLFQKTVSIVRRYDQSDDWKLVKYLVFDAPQQVGPFEDRLSYLESLFRSNHTPYAEAHPHERCRDIDHVKAELDRVEALGGEGLMMRKPGSKYEVGRSSTLLKVKRFRDAEARVVEHVPGAGKHKGRLGALLVEMPNGTRFNVGTGFSDRERENPPELGAIITYRYQELSDGGVPRFPSFVGVRYDFDFEAARAGTGSEEASRPAAAKSSRPMIPAPTKPSKSSAQFESESDEPKIEVLMTLESATVCTDVVERYASPEDAKVAFGRALSALADQGYRRKV